LKIFLSREQSECVSLSETLLTQGYELVLQSMIRREYIPFNINLLGEDSWLFFSSPYAVRAYFAQGGKTGKLAAIGQGTANELSNFGKVAFCGEDGPIENVAIKFKTLVQDEQVFFPSPEKGLRKIQQAFPANQITEIICYKTMPEAKKIEDCDLYIFSSPSNVMSFFERNNILKEAAIISFGASTTHALLNFEMKDVIESHGASDFELLKAINSAVQS